MQILVVGSLTRLGKEFILLVTRENIVCTTYEEKRDVFLQCVKSFYENVHIAAAMDISRLTIAKYSHLPAIFPAQRKLDRFPYPNHQERLRMFFNAQSYVKQLGIREYKITPSLSDFHRGFNGLFTYKKRILL